MDDIADFLGIDLKSPVHLKAKALAHNKYVYYSKLVKARRDAGLTQAEVAERMGVSLETVYEVENYYDNPRVSVLRRYAIAVGVKVEHKIISGADFEASLEKESD